MRPKAKTLTGPFFDEPKAAKEEDNHGLENAKACLESIREMVKAWNEAVESDDTDKIEEAERAIHEDALSVEVRSGWYSPGERESDLANPAEYCILLTTGGPAARLIGTLNEYGEPTTAVLEHQDWFKPWTALGTSEKEGEDLLTYASRFWFGEGR